MATRNFWIDTNIDGRQTKLTGGPRSKDGGMTVTISQRNEGAIETPVKVECIPVEDNKLQTRVYINNVMVGMYETIR